MSLAVVHRLYQVQQRAIDGLQVSDNFADGDRNPVNPIGFMRRLQGEVCRCHACERP